MIVMNEKVQTMLADQVNKEFYSAYLYLYISNYYRDCHLDGFAHWFFQQAKEEQDHAVRIMNYLQDNDVSVPLTGIAAPEQTFTDHRAPLQAALAHEQLVTGLIHALYTTASEAQDYRTCNFLDWFVSEQGEEEKSTRELLKKYDLYGQDARALYLLNAELKSRT